MRRPWTLLAALALPALLLPATARATGYAIYEQGAAALGMAGAATASVNDASAVFFNPAALARLEGTRFYVGGSALAPITSVTDPGVEDAEAEEMVKQVFFPPTIYASHRLMKGLGFGIGVNSPYGLGVEWDADEFSGRYLTTKVDLQTLNGSACLAWAPNEQWSFAGGADALYAKVLLNKRTLLTNPTYGLTDADIMNVEMSSDFTPGYGWNAAVLYTPAARWRVGAYYRSKIVVHVDEAEADFTQILTGIAPLDAYLATQVPPDQSGGTVLRFPALWSAGVAFDPEPDWTVEADFLWYEWSVFTDLPIYLETTPTLSSTRVEDYEDSWQVRVGAEHRRGSLAYRFGYYFDKSPAPVTSVSPLLPDADRIGVSLGLGWAFGPEGNWTLDAYGLGLFLNRRYGFTEDSYRDFTGDYETFTAMAGLGLGYRF